LNPVLKIYGQGECSQSGDVTRCGSTVKGSSSKQDLLGFLSGQVGGTPFPKSAFVYVCPIEINESPPMTGMSFVKTRDGALNVDVTAFLKFFADFDELIWEGTYSAADDSERSKDLFPFVIEVNGTNGGTTDIRAIGLGSENYNARGVDDQGNQKINASVQGKVVGDPENGNTFEGDPVLIEGSVTCTTSETFSRN
jgi:hypothetical protein